MKRKALMYDRKRSFHMKKWLSIGLVALVVGGGVVTGNPALVTAGLALFESTSGNPIVEDF